MSSDPLKALHLEATVLKPEPGDLVFIHTPDAGAEARAYLARSLACAYPKVRFVVSVDRCEVTVVKGVGADV